MDSIATLTSCIIVNFYARREEWITTNVISPDNKELHWRALFIFSSVFSLVTLYSTRIYHVINATFGVCIILRALDPGPLKLSIKINVISLWLSPKYWCPITQEISLQIYLNKNWLSELFVCHLGELWIVLQSVSENFVFPSIF